MIEVGDLVTDVHHHYLFDQCDQKGKESHPPFLGVVVSIMESRMGVCVKWSDAPLSPPLWHRPHRLEKVNG